MTTNPQKQAIIDAHVAVFEAQYRNEPDEVTQPLIATASRLLADAVLTDTIDLRLVGPFIAGIKDNVDSHDGRYTP